MELIIKHSIKAILGPISVWENFKEEVGWVLKHDMVLYVWKKRRVLHIEKCHEPGPGGGNGFYEKGQ